MNKMQAVKNLKKAYNKDFEEIIYMIKESKDDYNSLYELRLAVYEELDCMQGYIKSFFSHMYFTYFNPVNNKLAFKECRPNIPIERVFDKIDYETTEFLLQDYYELRKIMQKEEIKQSEKLDDYFKNYISK